MNPLMIVESKIIINPFPKLIPIIVNIQVHVFVFDATPQPFNENIVYGTTFAIHTDRNTVL